MGGPARIAHGAAFRASPAEVRPVHVVVEQAVGLILVDDGFHIGSQSFRVIGPAVKPYQEQVSVAGAELRHHLFAETLVPGLAVAGKVPVALGPEVVDAQQRVPADAHIDARPDAVFAAGVDKVAHDVSLAVAPFHGLQAIGIHVALPQAEARLMGGGQHGKLGTCRLGGFYPLVGVQLGGVEDVVVFYRVDAVVPLPVHLPVEHVQVVVEHHAHLGFVPGQLIVIGERGLLLCTSDEREQQASQEVPCFFHFHTGLY